MKVIIGACVGGGLFLIILLCVIVVVIYRRKPATTNQAQQALQLQPQPDHLYEQRQSHSRTQSTEEQGYLNGNKAPTVEMSADADVSCGEYLHTSPTEGIPTDNMDTNEASLC